MPPFQKSPSLVQQVCDRLAASRLEEETAARSTLLAEWELAAQLGVSRNVLREAIQRLELQGLVEIRQVECVRLLWFSHRQRTPGPPASKPALSLLRRPHDHVMIDPERSRGQVADAKIQRLSLDSRTDSRLTMRRIFPILATAASCLLSPALQGQVEFAQDSTVVLYGNSLVERLCEHGEMEAWIQLAHPGKKLRFRSLAWTGEEVGYRLRPEGYVEHLKKLHAQWPAQMVVAGFGLAESFRGEAGLEEFKTQLADFLRELQRVHPGAKTVLLTPTAVDAQRSQEGVDAEKRNADLALYAAAIQAVGRNH